MASICFAGIAATIGPLRNSVATVPADGFRWPLSIAAPRVAVWAALNDTEVLKAAIPGCHKIAWTGETTLDLEIKVNLGVVHPVFKGDLTLSDIVPAERYTLTGKGKGGLLGLAEGLGRYRAVRRRRATPCWSLPPRAAPPARS